MHPAELLSSNASFANEIQKGVVNAHPQHMPQLCMAPPVRGLIHQQGNGLFERAGAGEADTSVEPQSQLVEVGQVG